MENFLAGLAILADPTAVMATLGGLVLGITVGAIPGLTATMTIAVLMPLTFFMPPAVGIGFLLGIYKGAVYGGSIPAVLINTPGTAAAAATSLDGYALAKQGRGRAALEMSLFASAVGDLGATMILIMIAAPLAYMAVKFSSPEYTLLFFLSLCIIASVSGESALKGLMSAALGGLLACIGLDPLSASQRFTFGVTDLMSGISLVPLLIGTFALSEVLIQSERSIGQSAKFAGESSGERLRWREFKESLPAIFRSTGIGTFIGALPGLGAEIACWIGYGSARRISRHPERFGRGSLEGVAAAESGNNACVPATLIPMLAFGIPGDVVTAILLGAFIAQGLTPGPLLFINNGDLIYALYALLIISNIAMVLFGLGAIRVFVRIAAMPRGLILPCVVVLCFAGSYAVNSSSYDMIVMLIGGIGGYAMRKTGVPLPPMIISLLLTPSLENNLRQSLEFSNNSLSIFISRPISAALLALMIFAIGFYGWRQLKFRKA